MKKTKILVATAILVLGIGFKASASLPANSIVVGTNVYNVNYLTSANLASVNDQIVNNLGNIYYVDYNGVTKDIFTNSTVSDSQIIAKVGTSLTYYPGNGTTQKIVSDATNNYTAPSSANTGMNAIVSVSFNQLTGGINLFSCSITQLTGVSNAAYYKIGNGSLTALTDTTNYMDQLSTSSPILHIYASDGITELANGYVNIITGGSTSGKLNLTVNLTSTGASTGTDSSTQGNTAANIVNNGFATIDKNNQWIYYSNTGDGGKLYRKSVTGVDDFLISNDSARYINVVGDWVYYSNYSDNGKIYKVRTDGTEEQKVSDDMAACINVVGDNIYYINHSDRDRIYVQNSQGKKMLLTDQTNYLSVTGNYLFYVNVGDSNKLYSYNLQNYYKAKISDINTKFINACSDYLVFYTGLDGVLYRSTNAQGQQPVPMTVTTNVPQKSGKTTSYKTMTDKPTTLCATDDNNIYYVSYVDGNKIYKLDNTGNGFKVVDGSAQFINIVGNYLYYMQGGKVYVASKDGDGTQKGTAITKPKLSSKVVTVEPIPMYTTSDITTFNFPERVSCIMSDGSIQDLVVSWNRTIPNPSKGVYTFKGTILGYGNSVSISVGLDSGTINAANVTITNNPGNQDTLKATGLTAGDTLSVYNNSTDTKPVKTAVADANGTVNITGLSLSSSGGTLYVTVTKTGRLEGNKVPVQYPAEAPVGFAVNAAAQQVTGLKPGQSYKVYIQNENADGSIPSITASDATMTAGTADSSGNLIVSNMIGKIDGNANAKQMLRVVASGTVDSLPSAPVEISRAQMPSYVGIDLNLGRITGTTVGMVFTYDDPISASATWYPCTAGTTTISLTRSLQVAVKILANGPVLESHVSKYGLFPAPVITGITTGSTYTPGSFSSVTWSSNDNTNNVTYSAQLQLPSGTIVPITSASDLNTYTNSNGNGNYVFTVIGTKSQAGMTPSSATNSTSVSFVISSAIPSQVNITMLEIPGTAASNIVSTYYQATPTWTNLAGTTSTAVIKRVDASSLSSTDLSSATNLSNSTAWNSAAQVAFVNGYTLQQDGYYKIVVTTTSTENGATNTATKIFRVDTTDLAVAPTVTGVVDGGIYNSAVTPVITNAANCVTVPSIMLNGYSIPYAGGTLTLNGNYVLILNTTNTISGATITKRISFTMNTSNTNPTQGQPAAPTNVTFTFNSNGTAQLGNVDTTEEYSVNNGQSWTPVTSLGTQLITSTTELNSLNSTTTTGVQVRYKANGNTPASNPQIITLTTSPAAPTFTFKFGTYDTSGNLITDYDSNNKLIGALSGTGVANAQYSIDGGVTWKNVDSSNDLQSGDADLINTTNGIWIRTQATGQTQASNVEKITISQAGVPTVTPSVVSGGIALTTLQTGLEYRVNTGSTTGNWSNLTSGAVIPVTQAGTVDVRSKAVGTAMPGFINTITVQAAPSATIDYTNEQITGVNGNNMEWSTDQTNWHTFSGNTIDLNSNNLIPATGSQPVYVTYTPTGNSVGLTQAGLTINARPAAIDTTGINATITTSTGLIKIGGLTPNQVSAYDVITSTDGTNWSTTSTTITNTDSNGYGSITAATGVRYIKIRLKATSSNLASLYSNVINLTAGTSAATGTITFGAPNNGDTITIGGTTFTKASDTTGNDFVTIADLTSKINTLSNVGATNNGTTITVTAAQVGTAGNSITLQLGSSNTGSMSVSSTTLTGGQ